MKSIALFLVLILPASVAFSQHIQNNTQQVEITLERDSLRSFFGTYAFAPQFHLNIFSVNEKVFAQRIGDVDKFQIFPKQRDVFFLKAMPAELAFLKSKNGQYDTLVLFQDGKQMKAHKIYSNPYELYDTIFRLDSFLYDSYNKRDLTAFMDYFSADLEFYHDLTGKTNLHENLERFKTNFAKPSHMRRSLLKGSLEVYPIKDFGAIQIGTHQFYESNQGELEKLVAAPKFMHLWKKQGNDWKIVRIISFDH